MRRNLKSLVLYSHWRMVTFAGALGFVVALMAVEAVDVYERSLTSLSIALAVVAGLLFGGGWPRITALSSI